jgi:CheY-like chemotaxis protein
MNTEDDGVPDTGHRHGRVLRVLVAEDDEINRLVLKHALEHFDCQVVTVADGRAAVEALCDGQFDLVILDYHMPRMDGVQAAIAIRERERLTQRPRLSLVACTASAMSHELQECLDAGMDAVLTKPFSLDELAAIVAKWGGHPAPDEDST